MYRLVNWIVGDLWAAYSFVRLMDWHVPGGGSTLSWDLFPSLVDPRRLRPCPPLPFLTRFRV